MQLYSEIMADDLFSMLQEQPLLLVDVRHQHEVEKGMIAGAIHIPLTMLPVEYPLLAKMGNIVFYCQHGIRSTHAAAFATSKGCLNVYTLSGGVIAWEKAGYPLTLSDKANKEFGNAL